MAVEHNRWRNQRLLSGRDFQEIKSDIASLQKGELIIKGTTLATLGISGKSYKKIKVTHLI
jgi:hypothetical protein